MCSPHLQTIQASLEHTLQATRALRAKGLIKNVEALLFSRELQRKGRGDEENRNEDEGRRERNVVVELMRDRKGVARPARLQFYLGHRVPRSCWPLFVHHPSRTEAVCEITRHVTGSCAGRPFTAVNRLQWHAPAAYIHKQIQFFALVGRITQKID